METAPVAGAPAELEPGLEAARRALLDDPASFGFFQAVRLLERLLPERARVGHFADPADEVVRFSVPPTLAFPPAELREVRLPPGRPASMSVHFMGLTGPQGVLPPHYTVLAGQRAGARDEPSALAAFLDLFHHRLLSLFHRAWEKSQVALPAERGDPGPLRRHLLDVVGEGGGEPSRGGLEDALARYAGLLAPLPRGAVALEQLLADEFGVPVEVEQFVGGWHPLAAGELCRLGEDDGGVADRLGMGAVVGGEAWHPQSGIRIRLGPLERREYDWFLPTGVHFSRLRQLVRFHTHDQFECEARLVLARDAVPACVLGGEAQPLGWTTWARSRPPCRDVDDTILRL